MFKISNRIISISHPPLIIAEIGINHGGSLEIAKKMVDAAKKAGAEVIKHQTHIVEDEMSNEAKKVIPSNATKSIYEIIEECALSEGEERELMIYVKSKGLIFLSTPFSRLAADRLNRFGVDAFKIGSGECNNYPLLKHVANFGKPIILSTGMNSIKSVKKAVKIFRDSNVPFALLHCTNVYPTPPELVRLGAISELQKAFPNTIIGLSDHTISNYSSFGAIALGACIIERHFTDSMNRVGPDIVCSMDPKALKELIHGCNIIAKSRGGKKGMIEEEKSCSNFAFATIITTSCIKKGEEFNKSNIWVKRPGLGGILAEDYDLILGKTASRDIESNTHLVNSDIKK